MGTLSTNLPLTLGPALQLHAAGATSAAQPPDRLLICKWGVSEVDGGKSKLLVNDKTVRSMAANQKAPWEEIVVDFEHATEDANVPHPKPVAAYGKPVCVPNEGVYLTAMRWTPAGQEAWAAQSYADLSPALIPDADGNVLFFKSCALTTNGRVTDLHLYSANITLITDSMDSLKKPFLALLAMLGATALTDASTNEEIAAEAERLGAKEKTEAAAALAAKAPELSELQKLSAKVDAFEKASTERSEQAEKDAAVSAATALGKVITFSAEEITALPKALLLSHLAKLPAGQVPVKSLTGHALPGSAVNLLVDPEEAAHVLRLSAQLGITADDLKKFA